MQTKVCTKVIYNYMMEPGDGTQYRFGMQYLPEGSREDAYTVAAGVGPHAYQEYIWFYINMPGGCGVGVAMLWSLGNDLGNLASYLGEHGFGAVNAYTLRAVLLALNVLVKDPSLLEEAAAAMLKAPEYF